MYLKTAVVNGMPVCSMQKILRLHGLCVMYILEYNGVSAGCIAITHTESKTAQLRFFFVDAAVRGLGIGRKLMDLAIEFCRRKNYQHVFLWTFSQLDAARHLYANHGFQITDTQKSDHWGKAILEERWDLDLGCVSNV
jgi:GNAT superfamily N-acetyltransferase